MSEHVPLLDDAAVEAIRKKETARKKDRERKKLERDEKRKVKAQAKLEKEVRAAGKIPFLPTRRFWEEQRAKLSEEQRAQLQAQQEETLDTIWWAEAQIKGTYDVTPDDTDYYVDLELGREILQDDVVKYGKVCYYKSVGVFTELLQTDHTFIEIVRAYSHGYPGWTPANATEIWLKYGYLVGIPAEIADHPLMMAVHHPLTCSDCGHTDPDKNQLTREYYCDACTEKRRIVTAASWSKANDWLLQKQAAKAFPVHANTIYPPSPVHLDGWGRK